MIFKHSPLHRHRIAWKTVDLGTYSLDIYRSLQRMRRSETPVEVLALWIAEDGDTDLDGWVDEITLVYSPRSSIRVIFLVCSTYDRYQHKFLNNTLQPMF